MSFPSNTTSASFCFIELQRGYIYNMVDVGPARNEILNRMITMIILQYMLASLEPALSMYRIILGHT